jgi:hypothetical protein
MEDGHYAFLQTGFADDSAGTRSRNDSGGSCLRAVAAGGDPKAQGTRERDPAEFLAATQYAASTRSAAAAETEVQEATGRPTAGAGRDQEKRRGGYASSAFRAVASHLPVDRCCSSRWWWRCRSSTPWTRARDLGLPLGFDVRIGSISATPRKGNYRLIAASVSAGSR